MSTVLITGVSSGFGRQLVREFLAGGWTVLGTLRKRDQRLSDFEEEMKGGRLELFELDLRSQDQRAEIAELITSLLPEGLDVLINNAGYALVGALEDLNCTQLQEQMVTNCLAPMDFTRQVLPLLRKKRGRIINVSSVCGFSSIPMMSAYCASKFALRGFSEALRYELSTLGVQVTSVEPGGFRTQFAKNTKWGEKSLQDSSPYAALTQNFWNLQKKLSAGPGHNPLKVTRQIIQLATKKRMPARVQVGGDSVVTYWLRKILPLWTYDFLANLIYQKILNRTSERQFETEVSG